VLSIKIKLENEALAGRHLSQTSTAAK